MAKISNARRIWSLNRQAAQVVEFFLKIVLCTLLVAASSAGADGLGLTPVFIEEAVPVTSRAVLNPENHELKITLGKNSYTYPGPAVAQLELVDQQLSERQFLQFMEKRRWILTSLTRVLNVSRLGIGMMTYTKDKVSMLIPSRQFLRHPIEYLRSRWKPKTNTEETRAARQSTSQMIEKLVRDLDKVIWTQAPIIADANEFGLNFSVGISAEAGAGNAGWGGLLISGLSVSFNRDARRINWEFHVTKEKFQSAVGAITPIGVVLPRTGVFARHFSPNSDDAKIQGQTIYPPVAPISLTVLKDMALVEFDNPVAALPTFFPYIHTTTRVKITPTTILNYFKTRAQNLWSLVPAIPVSELGYNIEFAGEQKKQHGITELYSCFSLLQN